MSFICNSVDCFIIDSVNQQMKNIMIVKPKLQKVAL